MEYKDFMYNLHQNEKLNERGLNEYVGILLREIMDLKQEIIDLEHKLQYKEKVK